jgi:hypothetical protein
MTTRRTVLGLAGGVAAGIAGGGMLTASAGCEDSSGTGARAPKDSRKPELLLVEVAGGGLAAIDANTGKIVLGAAPSVLSWDGSRIIRTEQPGSGTMLTSRRLPGGEVVSSGWLTDRLAARTTSADGSLTALATPAAPGGNAYRPGARRRTTIVVAGSAGQRTRVDLPGNLEPEAFDVSGQFLFVLDYLPPAAPDRYRVRVIDLVSGELQPLLNRYKLVVIPGAEEEMRGEGRQAVHDPRGNRLFTLYTHQPDHVHSRDLVSGARSDAPHVHAFVHTLSLAERWAFCIDLPAPFGEQPAAGHAIALSPGGDSLRVVDATTGSVAVIDPAALTVTDTFRFPPPAAPSGAAAAFRPDGTLLVGAGREVVALPADRSAHPARWSTPSVVRGLAVTAGGSAAYVGQEDGVLRFDTLSGREGRRIAVPGLVSLRQVVASR